MPPVYSFRNTTILHCGASCTALGVFQRCGRGLRCVHFAVESFSVGEVGEDRWIERTAAALRALNATRQWTGPAVLVLPAHLTLTKQIKVPRVDSAKRAQVIRFEAEQAIPHALAEVVWECVPSGQRDTDENLMLVAAKREVVDELCAAVQAAGFEPGRILPFSLVTLTAFHLARPAFPQPALVLNLDGRSTTLLQVNGARFAGRTLAIGRATVTPQAAETQDGAPNEGERIKVSEPNVPQAAEEIQVFASRLAQEISRTVLHFGREGGLASPEHVFLTGGGARLAGLDVALADRLQMPVTHFDSRRAVEMSSGSTFVEPLPYALTDLSGAAAIALLPAQPAVDLLPPSLRHRASLRRRQPWLFAAALLVVAALVPPIVHYRQVTATARTKLVAMEKALIPLRAREARIRTDFAQLKQLKVQVAQLQSVHDRRTAWLQFFAGLQERLVKVEDVWFEQVQPIPPGEGRPMKLAVSGRMLDRNNPATTSRTGTNSRVRDLLAGLAELPQVAAVEGERFDHSQPGLLRFEFILVPNPAHPL